LLVLLDPSRDLGLPFLQLALKGTKISTPSGDRLVQELQIGDEVQTLTGRKTIKWIGYNKFTKEDGRAGLGRIA
jgi:hypothetical protein